MIHAICDFCGKDCDRTANLLTIQPFQNFARYDTDSNPYGYAGEKRGFVICSECLEAHELPNPYHHYRKLNAQRPCYVKTLHHYDDADRAEDAKHEINTKFGAKGSEDDG